MAVGSCLEEQELALVQGMTVLQRATRPDPVSGAAAGAPARWRGFGCSGRWEGDGQVLPAVGALRARRYLD